MFLSRSTICLIGLLANLIFGMLAVKSFASDLELEQVTQIRSTYNNDLEQWLDRDCFPRKNCCRDAPESWLYWAGAGSGLAVGPAMYSFGADLQEELIKNGRLTTLSPEVLGISSLFSNVVVYSSSSAEAIQKLRSATVYEKPLLQHRPPEYSLLTFLAKLAGPAQVSVSSAFAFMLYNHLRFVGPLGSYVFLLDGALMCTASISNYFFWDSVIESTPRKVRGLIRMYRPTDDLSETRDNLIAMAEAAENFALFASKVEIDELYTRIQDENNSLLKAQALLMAIPEARQHSRCTRVYHETLGYIGAVIGVISCYPNFNFASALVKKTLLLWGYLPSPGLNRFSNYVGLCGTTTVAVSSSFGTFYAFKQLAEASTEIAYLCSDACIKKKKPRCCRTKEELAHAAMFFGKNVILPLTYLGASLVSIIPQEYIGLVGSSSTAVLGLTTIAISGVATSYWGFDTLVKKVSASPKRQAILHASHRMLRVLPEMKDSILGYFYQSLSGNAEEIESLR